MNADCRAPQRRPGSLPARPSDTLHARNTLARGGALRQTYLNKLVNPERKLVGWKIWYESGIVLDSKNNKWEDCKQNGVQIVKMFYENPDGTQEINIHKNQEYYILNDLLKLQPAMKIGSSIEGEEFWKLFDSAEADKAFIEVIKS